MGPDGRGALELEAGTATRTPTEVKARTEPQTRAIPGDLAWGEEAGRASAQGEEGCGCDAQSGLTWPVAPLAAGSDAPGELGLMADSGEPVCSSWPLFSVTGLAMSLPAGPDAVARRSGLAEACSAGLRTDRG